MTPTIDARASGTFRIGGELDVVRLGFGAMRITGEGIWGEPQDPQEARRVLQRVPELGINFVDTAESYGPYVSEQLIGEVLAPYAAGTIIATKSGFTRTGPDQWHVLGRPEFLRQGVETSLRRLKLERIELFQLHRIDPQVPLEDQLGALKELQDAGKIRFIGLSQVSVEQIEAARRIVNVVTVQNLYNLANRQDEDVLEYCEREGIGFIPWYPVARGDLARTGGPLDTIARKLGATPAQVALAWLLQRSPVMLPIPGTGKVRHLEENTAAAHLQLPAEDVESLNSLASGT